MPPANQVCADAMLLAACKPLEEATNTQKLTCTLAQNGGSNTHGRTHKSHIAH